MKVAMFSAKPYDRASFERANVGARHTIEYLDVGLDARTARLAGDARAICVFVNDIVDEPTLDRLAGEGVDIVALRCAGYNNVDIVAADARRITVVRVPAYAPDAVAEHTLALILALDRRIYRAYHRVREGNFALDGLLGEGLHGRTAGVVGTGAIGRLVARLLLAFGCRVLAHDPYPNDQLAAAGVHYVGLPELFAEAAIISLNCPLTAETFHLVDAAAVAQMRPGVMLVNTGRGALVSTPAVIDGLKDGRIGSLALDVYEEEGPLFFEDRSAQVITDDVFARLLTFPNVLISAHQAFFTRPALDAIAATTLGNLDDIAAGRASPNVVEPP